MALTCLNLSGCKLTHAGAVGMAEALPSMPLLQVLDLSEKDNNDIGLDGVRALAGGLLGEEPARVRAYVVAFIKVLLATAPDGLAFLNDTPPLGAATDSLEVVSLEAAATAATPAAYDAWLYGRIAADAARVMAPRLRDEAMPDRLAAAFAEVAAKVHALRGPLRAVPRLVSPPLVCGRRVGTDDAPLVRQAETWERCRASRQRQAAAAAAASRASDPLTPRWPRSPPRAPM
jgi:hypothetical protein